MLRIFGRNTKLCDGITRREMLRVGGLAFGGLTLADVLRSQAQGASSAKRGKSVIMIWLRGGASHIDSYDMKPDAPSEIRGEFKPIRTNVPGIQVCEHLPLHAKMMDKLAIIRGIKSNDLGDHTPHYILTGSPDRGKRPVFGSVVSHLQPRTDGMPPYVSLMYKPPGLYDNEGPNYLGNAHRPFVPKSEGLSNLSPAKGVPIERLRERGSLLKEFDTLKREVDVRGSMSGIDEYTRRAMEMVASPKVRDAFDMKKESDATVARYGKYSENMLRARRLVEAGVSVVTLKVGDWDTHEKNFIDHKDQLPQLDQGVHALVSDLHDRGLDKDVAVVVWGEFGRAPKISRGDGRDHWPDAGAALIAGGGFKMGQVIGATDSHGGRSKVTPYTPGNVLSSLYQHLGIDPSITIPDHLRRPMYVLDERESVQELVG
ncbi:MAG: DUF1501 domain-containing protein [Gemmataceae bacterium]|nr:DUF1501 domain-containing protein [Gemmataceae bacterium]